MIGNEITDRLSAAGFATSADELANLARAFGAASVAAASDIADSLANAFADLPEISSGWLQCAEMWCAAQSVTTAWPEFRTGKRAKRGQGGRRKRSRRNCRRYQFDVWQWVNHVDAPASWYWSIDDSDVGPFDSEREARADARKPVA